MQNEDKSIEKHIMKESYERAERGPRKRGLKIALILICLLLLTIAGMVYYSYYTYQKTFDSLFVRFTENSPVINIGEKHRSLEYVSDYEGDIEYSEDWLRTDEAGEREVIFTVSKELFGGMAVPSKEFRFTYSVRDAIAPIMLRSGDGALIARGDDFDIDKIISYGDNADPTPEVAVEGAVDTDKIGDYPLHVTVSDSSGNAIDWDLTVSVVEELPSYEPSYDQTPFSEFMAAYAGEGRSYGIDVSTWQDDVDFNAVKSAGCEFVIIRIGYSKAGEVELDDKFDQNYQRAKDAGLRIGIYLYSYDNSLETVRRSANWIIEKLNGEKLDFPVVFDWEDFLDFQSYGMSFNTLNLMYDAFSEELGTAGYDTMLYGSKYYLENIWEDTDTRPIWLAHYVDETGYKDPFRIWQASCTGKIDGIDGDVDMNIMFE